MTNTPLKHLVNKCFARGGWLTSKGFNFEQAQLSYALDVVAWLEGDRSYISLFEGETGIGKTLAYLIPVCLQLAMTDKRAIVATHTIYLQNQIIKEGDLGLALDYLTACDLKPITVEQVIGAANYLNPERLKHQLKTWVSEPSEADRVLEAAKYTMATDGLIETFIGELNELPEGINARSIGIKNKNEAKHNPFYTSIRDNAKVASLIITTHTMSIIDSGFAPLLKIVNKGVVENPVEYFIVDEADAFEKAAESLSSNKLWPVKIHQLLKKMDAHLTPLRRKNVIAIKEQINLIERFIITHCAKRKKRQALLLVSNPDLNDEIESLVKALNLKLKPVMAFLNKKTEKFNADQLLIMDSLQDAVNFLDVYSKPDGRYDFKGLSISPVRKIPSLEIKAPKPAAVINQRLTSSDENLPNAPKVLLTSATLSDGVSGEFNSIKAKMGVKNSQYQHEKSYQPSHFGWLGFVLPDPAAPKPFKSTLDEESNPTFELSENWLTYAAMMIASAAANKAPLLVLTSSFIETRSLNDKLIKLNIHPICHLSGQKLSHKITEFQKNKTVLITPSAWEGVSIRDLDGLQLFKNLVITKIPMPPPDDFKEELELHYRKNGNPSLRDTQIENWLWVSRQDQAIRKMRQGIGRLIRRKTDTGTLWIADPRFPLPRNIGNPTRNYKRAIPERFLENYNQSNVFLMSGRIKPLAALDVVDKNLEELMEWL